VFSYPPCGERDFAETPRRTAPHDPRPAFFIVLAASVAFSSSDDTLFGVCTLLQRRLQRNGANGFIRATKGGMLGAMPFVVEAVLWTSVAVSVVLVTYLLVRRWL
jgi:hypothetical protein